MVPNFLYLSDAVRQGMRDEFELDVANGEVKVPEAVHPERTDAFINAIRAEMVRGGPDALAARLLGEGMLRRTDDSGETVNLLVIALRVSDELFDTYLRRGGETGF